MLNESTSRLKRELTVAIYVYLLLDVLDAVFPSLLSVHYHCIDVAAQHLCDGHLVPERERERETQSVRCQGLLHRSHLLCTGSHRAMTVPYCREKHHLHINVSIQRNTGLYSCMDIADRALTTPG